MLIPEPDAEPTGLEITPAPDRQLPASDLSRDVDERSPRTSADFARRSREIRIEHERRVREAKRRRR